MIQTPAMGQFKRVLGEQFKWVLGEQFKRVLGE